MYIYYKFLVTILYTVTKKSHDQVMLPYDFDKMSKIRITLSLLTIVWFINNRYIVCFCLIVD